MAMGYNKKISRIILVCLITCICSCKPFYSVIRPVIRPVFKFIHFVNTPTACNYKNFDTNLLKKPIVKSNRGPINGWFYDNEDALNWHTFYDRYSGYHNYKLSKDSISIVEKISSGFNNDLYILRYYKTGELKSIKKFYYHVPIYKKEYNTSGDLIFDSIFFNESKLRGLKSYVKDSLNSNPNRVNSKIRNITLSNVLDYDLTLSEDLDSNFIKILTGNTDYRGGWMPPNTVYFLNYNTLKVEKVKYVNINSRWGWE